MSVDIFHLRQTLCELELPLVAKATSGNGFRQYCSRILSWETANLLIAKERQMPNYRVIWRIDVEAESAVAAAERAREVQRHPESISSLFEVIESPSPGRQTDHSTPRIAVDICELVVDH
jgi:hypothetical protein